MPSQWPDGAVRGSTGVPRAARGGPLRGFAPATFARRRDGVLARLDRGAMVLPGAPVRFASRDTEYPFRADSELFYLSGMEEPDAVLVLRGHAEEEEEERFVLFVRPRDPKAERWSGPRLGPEGACERFGADGAYPIDELDERLPGLLEGATRVYHRLDQSPRVDACVRRALTWARTRGPRTGAGPRAVEDPGEILDDLRLVKDEGEVERLRRAASISVDAMEAAAAALRPGVGEWEIQATLEAVFRSRGADGPSYPSIVASGDNACVLHYVDNRDTVGDGDLVLIDAGAAVDLYCGDLTRTLPADGAFTAAQRAVYEVVDAARRAAIDAVHPGKTIADVHGAATRVLTEGMVALGALSGDPDELIEEARHETFYPHKTSHWLGLDVHDVGDYARAGVSRELAPGMALTVEPGLYFAREADGVPPELAGIGVRIEDMVLVVPDGRDVLSAELPSSCDEVEAWVGARAGG